MSEIPPTLPFRIQAAYGSQPKAAPRPSGVSKLVAGQVEGKVTFKAQDSVELSRIAKSQAPVAPRDVLPMYRNPMEKNAVATAVTLGRRLDAKA